ncbi:MAG TPA: PAS domain S-box protein, partial [Bacteroidota bacterium]|nr:PAS domain S-box protein [Bacteroidota bacterium]
MKKIRFSTGLPNFDRFIGGLFSCDSLLLFLSDVDLWYKIVHSITDYASSVKIPVVYLSVDDSLMHHISSGKKFCHVKVEGKSARVPMVASRLRRKAGSFLKGAFIFTDDLSKWKEVLRNDNHVIELFKVLTNFADRNNSVLVCSALRSAFNINNLTELKDSSSLCLDLIRYQGEVFCFPLNMKGRYISFGSIPHRLRFDELQKEIPGGTVEEAIQHPSDENKIASTQKEIFSLNPQFERIFRQSSEPMVLFELNGDFRDINSALESMLGYEISQLKIANPITLVSPGQKIRALRFLLALRHKKKISDEFHLTKSSGKLFPVQITVTNLGNKFYLAVIRDISDIRRDEAILRKAAEEYELIVNGLPHAILVLHNSKPLYANKAFYRIFGYDSFESISKKDFRNFITAESLKKYRKVVGSSKELSDTIYIELECKKNDNTTCECRITSSKIPFQGKQCEQISFIDISSEKIIQRRLEDSEKKYRSIVEKSPHAVALIRDNRFLFGNDAFLKVFGFGSHDDAIGQEITIVVDEQERERVREVFSKRFVGRSSPVECRYKGVKLDRTNVEIEMMVTPLHSEKDGVLLAFFQDVTESLRLIHELKNRSDALDLLKEITPVVHDQIELRKLLSHGLMKMMEVLSWNIGALYLVGPNPKEMNLAYHRNFPELLNKNLTTLNLEEGLGGFIAKTKEPHLFRFGKYPSFLPYRSLFKQANLSEICLLPILSHEHPIGMIFLASKEVSRSVQHSTELLSTIGYQFGAAVINAERLAKIQEAQERYYSLIESIQDILYINLPKGLFSFINSNVKQLVGYSPKDFYRNGALWLSLVHPDDKKVLLERTTRLNELGENTIVEYRILPRGKASYRWVRDTVKLERDENGTVVRLLGIVRDITDEKELIGNLQNAVLQKNNILSSLNAGLIGFDRNLKCVFWNHEMEKVTGIAEHDTIGKLEFDIFPSSEQKKINQLLSQSLGGEEVSSDDIRYKIPGKDDLGCFSGRFTPLRDQQGNKIGVLCLLREVSERKQREIELYESEQILWNVLDTMEDVLVITDLKGNVIQV